MCVCTHFSPCVCLFTPPQVPTPVCPCIALGIGPVAPGWASDAEYVGREILGIEFLNDGSSRVVDHFVKGPHHAWVDVTTGQIVRLWQVSEEGPCVLR